MTNDLIPRWAQAYGAWTIFCSVLVTGQHRGAWSTPGSFGCINTMGSVTNESCGELASTDCQAVTLKQLSSCPIPPPMYLIDFSKWVFTFHISSSEKLRWYLKSKAERERTCSSTNYMATEFFFLHSLLPISSALVVWQSKAYLPALRVPVH